MTPFVHITQRCEEEAPNAGREEDLEKLRNKVERAQALVGFDHSPTPYRGKKHFPRHNARVIASRNAKGIDMQIIYAGFRHLIWLLMLLAVDASAALKLSDIDSMTKDDLKRLVAEYQLHPRKLGGQELLAYAICHAALGKDSEAKGLFENYVNETGGDARAFLGLAGIAVTEKRLAEAVNWSKKGWAEGDLESLSCLAYVYIMLQRDYVSARKLIPALEKTSQTNDYDWVILLEFATTVKPMDEILFYKCIAGRPDAKLVADSTVRSRVAVGLTCFGDTRRHLELLKSWARDAIPRFEKDPSSFNDYDLIDIGLFYAVEKRQADAVKTVNVVLNRSPKNVLAIHRMGWIYAVGDEYAKAATYFEMARKSGYEPSVSVLTAMYLKMGDKAKARALIPDLMKLRSEDIGALQVLVEIAVNESPRDEELFFDALRGLDDVYLVSRLELGHTIMRVLREFGRVEHSNRLQKLIHQRTNDPTKAGA